MPIYLAKHTIKTEPGVEQKESRLIEAPNMAAAMRYAARDWIEIALCTTAEAVALGAAGVKIEKPSEE